MDTKSVASLSYIAGGKTPTAEVLAAVTQKPMIPLADLWNKDIKPLSIIMSKQKLVKSAGFSLQKLFGKKPAAVVPQLSTAAESKAMADAAFAAKSKKIPMPSKKEDTLKMNKGLK